MSRDYKDTHKKSGPKGGTAALLMGIFIGLLLGLSIALGVAWYINRLPTPFLNHSPTSREDPAKNISSDVAKAEDKAVKPPDAKPRFDFYKILPGAEEPATDQQFKEAQRKAPASPGKEAFFLQAGAFQNAPEADNLKARIALLGLETTIQTTTLPDNAVWHRVRVGPYGAIEQLERARDTLKQNGIETTLIKVRESSASSTK